MKLSKKDEIIGKKFNFLTVLKLDHIHKKYTKKYLCRCDCGQLKITSKSNLLNNHVKSCGCFRSRHSREKATTHGMRYTRFYQIWKGINGRCYVKKNKAHELYGAKNIGSDWKNSFFKFKEDMYDSYLLHVETYGEKNTSIDRIDNTKNYSKENCRWATNIEQANNKSNVKKYLFKGEQLSLPEISRRTGFPLTTLRGRKTLGSLIDTISKLENQK